MARHPFYVDDESPAVGDQAQTFLSLLGLLRGLDRSPCGRAPQIGIADLGDAQHHSPSKSRSACSQSSRSCPCRRPLCSKIS